MAGRYGVSSKSGSHARASRRNGRRWAHVSFSVVGSALAIGGLGLASSAKDPVAGPSVYVGDVAEQRQAEQPARSAYRTDGFIDKLIEALPKQSPESKPAATPAAPETPAPATPTVKAPAPTPTPTHKPTPTPTPDPNVKPQAKAPLPANSGEGKRVVFDITTQQVWLVDANNSVARTYKVSGSRFDQLPAGTYNVFSKSRHTTSWHGTETMEYMVRFHRGENANIGFHDIPVASATGKEIQTLSQLGTPLSDGCIRQDEVDAEALWEFAPVGTQVVVTRS